MAFEIPGFKLTLVAGEDLSAKQYRYVKMNASGEAVVCTAVTDKPVGILQNAPASGGEAEIMCDGVSKLSSDEALAINDVVGTSADGQGQVVVVGTETTVYANGIVLEASSAAGELASVLFNCMSPGRAA